MSEKVREPLSRPRKGVLFDLDGVLTDTASLHYESWKGVAAELGLHFDRAVNDRLRGLSRRESLAVLLGDRISDYSEAQQQALTDRKNRVYLQLVSRMTPADLLDGVPELLKALRGRGVATAVASSSRNAEPVLERLGIRPLFDAVVDANTAPLSKPDPQVFLAAASAVGVGPEHCLVVEDAEAGVAAGHAAGMRVVGIGPVALVGAADLVVPSVAALSADRLLALLGEPQK